MYRPCVFSILTPLCHITFFVLRHSNSYCVNFVRISKNTVPYVPSEIFAAIFRFLSHFAAILRLFSAQIWLSFPKMETNFLGIKNRELRLFTGDSRVLKGGCPVGLEPTTFRTTI